MNTLKTIIKTVGVPVIANECEVTKRAVYKWMDRGSLPLTDFCGKTNYSKRISDATNGKFSQQYILDVCKESLLGGQ